jgi:Mn2+/Fe2+ NRAMP family transporter
VWWWFIMLLATVFQLGAMVGGVGQALHLAFPQVSPWVASALGNISPGLAAAIEARPEHTWAILTALAAVLLLLSGGYKQIELITTFLVVGVTFVTVACAIMLQGTGYPVRVEDLQQGFSLNVLLLPGAAIAAAFGTFGITGVGASELYAYPYWCLEKGYAQYTGKRSKEEEWAHRAKGWMRVMYLDAWVSMIVFTVATVAFYVMGATVLNRQHLHPDKDHMIETLAEMYVPAFGSWTKIFFLIGAWAVLFKTLYVASAGHARLSTDFLGLTGAVKFHDLKTRPRWISRFCVFYPVLALVLYLFFRNPRAMVIVGGFFQAATLPIITGAAIYLRYFRLDPRLAPSRWWDLSLWFAFLTITAVSLYAIPQWAMNDLWPVVRSWLGSGG